MASISLLISGGLSRSFGISTASDAISTEIESIVLLFVSFWYSFSKAEIFSKLSFSQTCLDLELKSKDHGFGVVRNTNIPSFSLHLVGCTSISSRSDLLLLLEMVG